MNSGVKNPQVRIARNDLSIDKSLLMVSDITPF